MRYPPLSLSVTHARTQHIQVYCSYSSPAVSKLSAKQAPVSESVRVGGGEVAVEDNKVAVAYFLENSFIALSTPFPCFCERGKGRGRGARPSDRLLLGRGGMQKESCLMRDRLMRELGLGFGFSSSDGVVGGEERGKPAAEATSALRL